VGMEKVVSNVEGGRAKTAGALTKTTCIFVHRWLGGVVIRASDL